MLKIILASKSNVRREMLEKNNISCEIIPSNIDEEPIKESLIAAGANPEDVSKNLAEIKANKVSQKQQEKLVLGADSVIDLNGEIISKPENRNEAFKIMNKLNGKKHLLISSACISKNGHMIWNNTDKAEMQMKKFDRKEIKDYLSKISDEVLFSYNVYQIEGLGKMLFSSIRGDKNTIMGLPLKSIKNYLESLKL